MWERFTGSSRRSVRPEVSITKRHLLVLNSRALEAAAVVVGTFVVLYYEAEQGKIGLRFTSYAGELGARRATRRGSAVTISARPFLLTHGIAQSATLKMPLVWDEKENLWVAEVPHHLIRRKP